MSRDARASPMSCSASSVSPRCVARMEFAQWRMAWRDAGSPFSRPDIFASMRARIASEIGPRSTERSLAGLRDRLRRTFGFDRPHDARSLGLAPLPFAQPHHVNGQPEVGGEMSEE